MAFAKTPFSRRMYRAQIQRYVTAMVALFSDITVNTEGKIVRLPVMYTGGFPTQDATDERASVCPVITIEFLDWRVNPEKVTNRTQRERFGEYVSDPRLPVILTFEIGIRVSKQDEMFQLIEMLSFLTYPQLDMKIIGNGEEGENIIESLKLVMIEHSQTNNFEGDMLDGVFWDVGMTFDLEGCYFYGENFNKTGASSSAAIIKEVDIQLLQKEDDVSGKPWFSLLADDEAVARLAALRPLESDEGVYVADPTKEGVEVIASGNWTRDDYKV